MLLQAHTWLWDYLWVAPNLLLLLLAGLMAKRELRRQFPAFFVFAIVSAIGQVAVFFADVSPFVSPLNFWRVDWASLLIESFLKFLVIGEIFSQVFNPYPSISKLAKISVRGLGGTLVLLAAVAAGYSRGDSTVHLISGAHLLEQTVFFIEVGLLAFLFLFAGYFHLSWNRLSFGVALGLAISACEHLATWAVMSNTGISVYERHLLDFLNMATYHFCVLIWFYYLLVPHKVVAKSSVPPPDNHLDVWNRELERLVHQ